ncbi:Panacea domain-containing protein [Pectobacterium aroidearum]|uniref:Panacea domain-containing protein n=1 Tax=Pectobacterium aroidearum TaxID=1201031 RepID=UPI001CD40A20|nr:type II toxin-antitoxin system antitoxin SocA domain-containing protein [Pectobacterium aroidearum]
MKAYRAENIATWFILKFAESGDVVTHLKIQKLLYYAEAWCQVINNSELFVEKIEAWAHGPVVPEVFHLYKKHGWNPLPIPKDKKHPKLSPKTKKILNQVIESYGELPAKTLENMTHNDEPWINARKGLEPEERCEVVIPKADIKSFFKKKYRM